MAENNSVRVYHWDDVYDIISAKKLPFFRSFLDDSVDNPIAYKRSLGFSRMLPCHNNDRFSIIFLFVAFGCNHQCLNIFLGNCFADHSFGDVVRIFMDNLVDFVANFFVGVGVRMGEKHFVVMIFVGDLKG